MPGIADLDAPKVGLHLGDVLVENGGRAPSYREEQGQRVMKQAEITIRVTLGPRRGVRHGVDLRLLVRLREDQRRLSQLVRRKPTTPC